jgi:hypothetical protein
MVRVIEVPAAPTGGLTVIEPFTVSITMIILLSAYYTVFDKKCIMGTVKRRGPR